MLGEIKLEKDKYCVFTYYAEQINQICKQMNKYNKTETGSPIQRVNKWLPEGRGVRVKTKIGEGD